MDILAVGDVISAIGATTATTWYYQPAAGVEIMVLWCSADGTAWVGVNNGTLNAQAILDNTGELYGNIKFGITNTMYLSHWSSGTIGAFSGIQIK